MRKFIPNVMVFTRIGCLETKPIGISCNNPKTILVITRKRKKILGLKLLEVWYTIDIETLYNLFLMFIII